MSTWSTDKACLSDGRETNISGSFIYKMAAKTSWHRYRTKLRHCHPVYNDERTNKKLSYRRGTARRVVPVETVRNVAKMFVQLLLTFTTISSTLYTKKPRRINRILRTYTLLKYLNNTINLRLLTLHSMSCYTHKMAIISWESGFLTPKISAKFHRGQHLRKRQMQVGWVKTGDFRQITGYISKKISQLV